MKLEETYKIVSHAKKNQPSDVGLRLGCVGHRNMRKWVRKSYTSLQLALF